LIDTLLLSGGAAITAAFAAAPRRSTSAGDAVLSRAGGASFRFSSSSLAVSWAAPGEAASTSTSTSMPACVRMATE
jgi:hypothetical protein